MPAILRIVSLRRRLTLALTVLILAVFGSAALFVDQAADRTMQQRFDATLLVRANAIAALLAGAYGDTHGREPVATGDSTSWYQLRCGHRLLAHTMVLERTPHAAGQPAFADTRLASGIDVRQVTLAWQPEAQGAARASTLPTPCALDYAMAVGSFHGMLHDIDLILIGSLLFACLLIILATPWVGGRALRPLAALTRVMADIGPDTPDARLPASRTAELAPLTRRFNEVLARMDDGIARERRFAAGVAHEFRTRLAELRVLVDVETRYPSGRAVGPLLAEVGAICGELEATVAALLQLTRIQAGLEQLQLEQVPLAPVIERIVARHRQAAAARGLTLHLDDTVPTPIGVRADVTLLEVVLDNLLGNAMAYAPDAGTIALRIDARACTVSNAAPELEVADVARLSQPFWRKSPAGSGHAGLGLALAAAAAKAMHLRLNFTLENGRLCASLAWDTPAA